MSGTNTAEIGFEKQIWEAADILRGNIDAAEYKHVVLGRIFLKYISDKFDARYQGIKAEQEGRRAGEFYDNGDMAMFDSIVESLFEAIKRNQQESVHLAEIRDTLLPCPMSGELSVVDIET
ncbi:MAG: type I restriction-modification system subunit M N-terminal domain-containing protein [Desulfovibrio sp.]|jgi:type I restriction-modification system DNA methylase subunit|nr:type I restriction-modification system subunit M N-terminal domain-containing protein [Desulfovibrio sp.]